MANSDKGFKHFERRMRGEDRKGPILFAVMAVLAVTSISLFSSEDDSSVALPDYGSGAVAHDVHKEVPTTRAANEDIGTADPLIVKEFNSDRAYILKLMRDSLKTGYPIAAASVGERYAAIQDEEFQKLYREARGLEVIQKNATNRKIAAIEQMEKAASSTFVQATANTLCRHAAKRQLLSPTSAKFPILEGALSVGPRPNTLSWNSYVDAENGFGAKLRTEYFCILRFQGQDIDERDAWVVETINAVN